MDWILPQEIQDTIFREGHGTAPDLIYARGVPDNSTPDPGTVNRKQCILIIIEVGFCQDFACHTVFWVIIRVLHLHLPISSRSMISI